MRCAYRPGSQRWLLLLAPILVLSVLLTGCGGNTPAYCSAASGLKTSVQDLEKVDVAKNGLGSMKTALDNVSSNANTFISEAKSAYSSQTAALRSSLSDLSAAIKSAVQQPSVAALDAVRAAARQVEDSASALDNAVAGSCK
jgi:hypothetical protein